MTELGHSTAKAIDGRAAAEVYYDGACPVCAREIAMYRRLTPDGRVTWSDAARGDDRIAPDLTRKDALARLHVRRTDGRLVDGAAAFLAIWRGIDRLRPLAIALDRPSFVWLGDMLYSGFLTLRRIWRPRGT